MCVACNKKIRKYSSREFVTEKLDFDEIVSVFLFLLQRTIVGGDSAHLAVMSHEKNEPPVTHFVQSPTFWVHVRIDFVFSKEAA